VSFAEDLPEVKMALDAAACVASTDPESEAGRRELSRLVQLTLDQLPGQYGQVLEWKYIQELSVDEIANRLGVGYKAAESLLTRARQAFRDAFAVVGSAWPIHTARGATGPEGP
jgi:RNA polymerase sigma factor (sigma-70 family)